MYVVSARVLAPKVCTINAPKVCTISAPICELWLSFYKWANCSSRCTRGVIYMCIMCLSIAKWLTTIQYAPELHSLTQLRHSALELVCTTQAHSAQWSHCVSRVDLWRDVQNKIWFITQATNTVPNSTCRLGRLSVARQWHSNRLNYWTENSTTAVKLKHRCRRRKPLSGPDAGNFTIYT